MLISVKQAKAEIVELILYYDTHNLNWLSVVEFTCTRTHTDCSNTSISHYIKWGNDLAKKR